MPKSAAQGTRTVCLHDHPHSRVWERQEKLCCVSGCIVDAYLGGCWGYHPDSPTKQTLLVWMKRTLFSVDDGI
jgi:hypothetical protein